MSCVQTFCLLLWRSSKILRSCKQRSDLCILKRSLWLQSENLSNVIWPEDRDAGREALPGGRGFLRGGCGGLDWEVSEELMRSWWISDMKLT